ncbi:hypothetical protein QTP70_000776 [Hemibagrus guttatus]|uniref:Uncharacterized protein n=1 Tax=Hemibagrus guttatus TaxID=175788 RepID=A0AAE0QC54_9TELE|nr:hypothetical protein QTP70_000776 [Hemibagrus guttatus]
MLLPAGGGPTGRWAYVVTLGCARLSPAGKDSATRHSPECPNPRPGSREVSSLKNSILGMRMWMMSFSQSGMGEKAEYYDDVIDTSDLISDPGRVDPPEDYDDAVTAGPIPDNVDEDEAENYDDAITADQKSVILTEDVSENYDDAVTTETNPNIITESPEDYDDVITEEQDVGETEGGEAWIALVEHGGVGERGDERGLAAERGHGVNGRTGWYPWLGLELREDRKAEISENIQCSLQESPVLPTQRRGTC